MIEGMLEFNAQSEMNTTNENVNKAIRQNTFISKYVMALDHALLWVAALCLAAYFHVSEIYPAHEALLFSTLVAYVAYLCESGLETLKVAYSSSLHDLNFRRAGLWHWIALNILVNVVLSILFLSDPNWIYLMLIILTAGWQKYMDGRIPPRLKATQIPLAFNNSRS